MGSDANLAEGLRRVLRDHADEADSDITPRVMQIADLADERRAGEETGESEGEGDAVAKSLLGVYTRLEKGEVGVSRERLEKAKLALEVEHLAKTNPKAAAEWEASQGVHRGVTA